VTSCLLLWHFQLHNYFNFCYISYFLENLLKKKQNDCGANRAVSIIIIIIIIIIISFMQGIYTYIPETSYVPREYSVAAILLL